MIPSSYNQRIQQLMHDPKLVTQWLKHHTHIFEHNTYSFVLFSYELWITQIIFYKHFLWTKFFSLSRPSLKEWKHSEQRGSEEKWKTWNVFIKSSNSKFFYLVAYFNERLFGVHWKFAWSLDFSLVKCDKNINQNNVYIQTY
jgi:hypothetical protein